MVSLRRFLLAFVLLAAQLAAGAHAIEHAAGKEGALPGHVCPLCVASHDLGAALPGMALLPPLIGFVQVPEAIAFSARSHLPAPAARQGAPPLA